MLGEVETGAALTNRRQVTRRWVWYARIRRGVGAVVRTVRTAVGLGLDYLYDLCRYVRHSSTFKPYASRAHFEARLIMNYHRIEKALSLREPREGFGQQVAWELAEDLERYVARYGFDVTAQVSLNVLAAFLAFHRDRGHIFRDLEAAIQRLRDRGGDRLTVTAGGVMQVTSADIHLAIRKQFAQFVEARHSIRQFAPTPVDVALIKEAVRIAIHTPSVCNRQMWRVRVYEGQAKERVLALQNGNRGFGHEADKVLIVTGDLQYFVGTGERNQVYIDGGMFAMTLIYALHSLGLGTCALNLSIGRKTDRELRQVAGIPAWETFIMMIAVGHLPDVLPVAQSPRRSVDEVLVKV